MNKLRDRDGCMWLEKFTFLFILYCNILTIIVNLIFATLFGQLNAYELKYYKGKIEKVIDGDTAIIGGKKVRFACVDTYESKRNRHLVKQVKETGLSERIILRRGLEQKKELEKYLFKEVYVYFDADSEYDLYRRVLGVAIYQDKVLNKGLPYYDKKKICKGFKINYLTKK